MASTQAVQAIPVNPMNPRTNGATNVITATIPGAFRMSDRRSSRFAAAAIPDRKSKATHGRILLASLTAAGRRALDRGRAVAQGVQDRVLTGRTASDRRTLIRHLEAIERVSTEATEAPARPATGRFRKSGKSDGAGSMRTFG